MSLLHNSRREFIQTATATAASIAIARSEPHLLPTVKFGKHNVSRLIIGTNPFFGYTHFNAMYDKFTREYYTMDKRAEVLHNCEKAGINTWQLHYHADTIALLQRIRNEGWEVELSLRAQRQRLGRQIA